MLIATWLDHFTTKIPLILKHLIETKRERRKERDITTRIVGGRMRNKERERGVRGVGV